ncbi:MAG: hypothetical protein HDR13_07770 [Lachnospiraceae bacterium]|nr:hypothetical protein [Lachnospiraceae bacterium]MBD5488679.1 hypothetical protein [Lachnospiraceae bacterium]
MNKKKKGYIIGLVVLGLVVGTLILGSSDDTNDTAKQTVKEEQEAADENIESVDEAEEESEEAEEVAEKDTKEDHKFDSNGKPYLSTGYSIKNDIYNFKILSIGMVDAEDDPIMKAYVTASNYRASYIYATVEFENTSSDEIYIGSLDNSLYIDDYQYDVLNGSGAPITVDGITSDMYFTLNPSRKAKFIVCTFLPEEAFTADKVEFEILNSNSILFKENGEWLFGSESTASAEGGIGGAIIDADGIGNVIIDADPDRYIPEGISGGIDVIDGAFYADSGNKSVTPGEYLAVGGDNTVITITDDSIEIKYSNKDDGVFELAEAGNGSPCYWAESDNDFYCVSFFEGGLYIATDSVNDENDWIERFYELLD